jgi:hypothetical protein
MTPYKTFTKTGAQVPDPNYPPTSRQMLQVWDAAWGKNQAECPPQMTPQQQKEYSQAYKTYLQVRQTLTAKVAAEAQAQQPKASNQSLVDAAEAVGLSPKTPGLPIEMPPAQTKPHPVPEHEPSPPVEQPITAKVLQDAKNPPSALSIGKKILKAKPLY